MDTGNIGAYTDYLTSQSTSANKLQDALDKKDYSTADKDELFEACKQFEAYFLEQVFKEMQKTVDCVKDEKNSSTNSMIEYFKDTTLQDLAATSTETQGLGIAQMLYEQMKRNYGL